MSDVTTVEKLAKDIGIPVEKLRSQLREALHDEPGEQDAAANDQFKPNQQISGQQKKKLLDYLKRNHGSQSELPNKITLQRRQKKQVTANGHKVSVVVRKKRTYKKRTEPSAEQDANNEVDSSSVATPEVVESSPIAEVSTAQEEVKTEAVEHQVESNAALNEASSDVEDVGISAEPESAKQTQDQTDVISEPEAVPDEKATTSAKAEVKDNESEVAKAKTEKKGGKKKQKHKPETEDPHKQRAKADAGKKRHQTKANIKSASFDVDDEYEEVGNTPVRRKRRRRSDRSSSKPADKQHGFEKPTAPIVREIQVPETISVAELAQRMAVKAAEVIKVTMKMGAMVTINQVIDQDTAALIVEEFGHNVKLLKENAIEESLQEARRSYTGEQQQRAPVVTIMGHVDHGKTSLLDYIRRTKVTDSEAGGITQHIGAYGVETERGKITFLDTPGHAAFTAMRARGANCTDIVVLVVAADDGVMPQTIEAIQHAKAAKVPVVVAINKMDKPEADPERVRNELSQHDVISEDWGGDTMFVPLSAKTGDGVEDLLEAILLQSEVLELSALTDCPGHGVVVESRLDRGRGVVATILVQEGCLNRGDIILSGLQYGRVRAMLDEKGQSVDSAGPSTPVEVLGLSGAPTAGDDVIVVPTEKKAREVALFRQGKYREVKLARQKAQKLENLFENINDGDISTLNILIKADVLGSAEALTDSLMKLSSDEVRVNVIASNVGGINESDVHLALASKALIIGFNVRADAVARRVAEEESVELNYFSVIYEVIDTVKSALSGMLSPEVREEIIGLAQVREVFRSAKLGAIAGCMVIDGVVKRNNPIRVLRDNVVIYEGELESLRRYKEDIADVRQGMECGIGVKNYNDVKENDQIEVYERIEVKREL